MSQQKNIVIMSNYDNAYLGVENSQHPANEIEIDTPQVTIDEWWYLELKENREELFKLKKILKNDSKLQSNSRTNISLG